MSGNEIAKLAKEGERGAGWRWLGMFSSSLPCGRRSRPRQLSFSSSYGMIVKSLMKTARELFVTAWLSTVFMGIAAAVASEDPLVTWHTRTANFGINARGSLSELSRADDKRSYLAAGQPAPLLSVRLEGKLHAPYSAAWDAQTKRLTLRFADVDATAVVAVEAKPTHVVFEVVDVQPTNRVELVLWGPYPTTIGDLIGETVGVDRKSTRLNSSH